MIFTSSARTSNFYPRPPRGGRRPAAAPLAGAPAISIHALREEGDDGISNGEDWIVRISIHALREEGDPGHPPTGSLFAISIHALREEGDVRRRLLWRELRQFLSTPSARRATTASQTARTGSSGFLSTPSARRATQDIHRPAPFLQFLSTPSARRATYVAFKYTIIEKISIHALREEGDPFPARTPTSETNFYPRPPRGGRLSYYDPMLANLGISIHALREEGDQITKRFNINLTEFLSTPSARRATRLGWYSYRVAYHFYPRPPRGGRLTS